MGASVSETCYQIVPEPVSQELGGHRYPFGGFANFPEPLGETLGVPKGRFRIERIEDGGHPRRRDPAARSALGVNAIADSASIEIADGVVRVSGDERLYYPTLIQIARQCGGSIHAGRIDEELPFRFRGYHVDIGRGGVPLVQMWERMLRLLYLCKYTHLAIYYEDLYPWRRHPEIGSHRGRLTDEELEAITSYGAALGIEVFPSLELAGHMEQIIAVEGYWSYGEWLHPKEGCLDVTNPKAVELSLDLLREAVERTESGYIHIGGDESWAMGRGKSLDKLGRYAAPELYEEHHRKVIKIVRDAGKTPLIWGDLIAGSIEFGDQVSEEAKRNWAVLLESPAWREAVIANWIYDPHRAPEALLDRMKPFLDRGLQQIVCPTIRASETFYPMFARAEGNVWTLLEAARRAGVPGFLQTSWGDMGNECLTCYCEPMILATAEAQSANANTADPNPGGSAARRVEWRAKWRAITGESEAVTQLRYDLGRDPYAHALRAAFQHTYEFTEREESERESILDYWEHLAEEYGPVPKPPELEFQLQMGRATVNRYRGSGTVAEYLGVAATYAELWRSERKPETLDVVIGKLWAAAGRLDQGFDHDSSGWLNII